MYTKGKRRIAKVSLQKLFTAEAPFILKIRDNDQSLHLLYTLTTSLVHTASVANMKLQVLLVFLCIYISLEESRGESCDFHDVKATTVCEIKLRNKTPNVS